MQLLSNDIIRAIGWTLIHSLWQGLVLALLAGILILFTRKSRPALRYNIFTLLFFVLVGSAVLTFFYELRQPAGHRAITAETPVQVVTTPELALENIAAQAANTAIPEPDFTQRFVAYFNEHAPLLVMLWFIVFVARSLWLFGGLVYVQRIRHYKTSIPAAAFVDQLSALCSRIRLNSKVQLLESAMVKVPTALGMFKPIILMPLGMMAQLPPDQVEAVLLHELAHIRRRDFLVNVVQHFAETIFFFNPALLWLSARIREEREHCCDDIAIGVTQSRNGYIQALVSFQEFQLAPRTKYAMAFPGRKKQLLDRVKRILGSKNKTLNIAEKSFLLLCFSLTGMLGFVFSQPEKKQLPKTATEQVLKIEEKKALQEISPVDQPASEKPQADQAAKDETAAPPAEDTPATEPPVLNAAYYYYDVDIKGVTEGTAVTFGGDPYRVYLFKRNNVVYQVQWDDRHNELAALKVNGTEVFTRGMDRRRLAPYTAGLQAMADIYRMPYQSQYQPYQPQYQPWQTRKDSVPVLKKENSVMTGTMTTTVDGKQYKILLDNNKVTGLEIDGVKVPDDELPAKYPVIKSILDNVIRGAVDVQDKRLQQQTQITSEKTTEALQEQRKLSEMDASNNGRLILISPMTAPSGATPASVATSASVATTASTATTSLVATPAPAATPPPAPHPVAAPKPVLDNEAEKILKDLRKDGLIKNSDRFFFRLNQTEFIVDGQKQTDEVFRKYKEKYIKQPSDLYMYSKSHQRTTITINN
jgi:beta-lactamase regulating signal transducer with metallopeptidase domain